MYLRSMELNGMSGHAAGRVLLEAMYRKHTGRPMPPILTTGLGKPYFEDGGLHFSISHTKRRVFCAISEKPIGIDAEELDRQIDLRLAEKILSAPEKARYDAAPDKRLALLSFWVLKEAEAKRTGRGLQGYPNKTDFAPDDPRVQIRDNCLVAIIENEQNQP